MSLIGVDLCRSRDGTINHEQLIQHGRASLTPALFHQDNRVPGRFRAPAHPLIALACAATPLGVSHGWWQPQLQWRRKVPGLRARALRASAYRHIGQQGSSHSATSRPPPGVKQGIYYHLHCIHMWKHLLPPYSHSQGSEQETLQIYQTFPLHSCSSYLQLVRFSSPD